MGFVDTRSRTVEPPPAVPWALQPAYPAEIVTDRNGVIWGTLDALVNKLTTGGLIKDPISGLTRRIPQAWLMRFVSRSG
jgi:son of sevenless-like protein